MSEFDALIEAAQAERQRIYAEIERLDAAKGSLLEQAKRYDRVINAADPEAKKRPAAPKGPKRQDWRVSSSMIEQIYASMRANGNDEYSAAEIAVLTGVSEATVSKTINILHEEGRIKLLRTTNKGKRFWGVVEA